MQSEIVVGPVVSEAAERADWLLRERLTRLGEVADRLPILLTAMMMRHNWSHAEREMLSYARLALEEFDAGLMATPQ